ncbi:MAG: cytochrome c biogenesis protein CcsA [Bacteroidales bacterium]|nr:cytochrome c biogenesis protein CcsA [Bacteroidales bacterium]
MILFDINILFPTVIGLWILGIILFFATKSKKINNAGLGLLIFGTFLLVALVVFMWINLERPPMRTLGETRLWYGILVPVVGFVLYFRWKMKWAIGYSIFLATVFVLINYLTPENFDKSLMPALQSIWFVPHVIVYMFAYAILSASMLIAIKALVQISNKKLDENLIITADNVVYTGFAFLSFGLLFGAFWAKEAWGHYWTWDPKETWAFITWLFYLIYIHLRHNHKENVKPAMWILALAFIFLLICWLGVNYLPSAQTSVHTYST